MRSNRNLSAKDARTLQWHLTFMRTAREMAKMSHCASSKKVCCLLVRDGQIISSGINGTLPGLPNCDEIFQKNQGIWSRKMEEDPKSPYESRWRVCDPDEHHNWSKLNEVHAEQNAIAGAARRGMSVEGAVAYVTHSPCSSCALLLGASGISKVVVGEVYDREPEAFKVLEQKGIEVLVLPQEAE